MFGKIYLYHMGAPELFLQALGLTPKEVRIYLTLLRRGPSSVRQLAQAAEINRGTTYDVLKALQQQGVVSFYEKAKKSYFVAEDPKALESILKEKKAELKLLNERFEDALPELRSISKHADVTKPVARYFHGSKGVARILEEVLLDVDQLEKKHYCVYSSSAIAQHLYDAIPDFTERRVSRLISVTVIGLGEEKNGNDPLSDRKSLTSKQAAPTYTIIFGRKTAFISLDDHSHPRGVIIDDGNLAEKQRFLFDSLWQTL